MNIVERFKNYLLRHIQVMLASLGDLWRHPLASIMTIVVIGIALALPAGLLVMLTNVAQISGQWQDSHQISLFLNDEVGDTRGQQLAEQLLSWPDISAVEFKSSSESLEEFRELSGLGSMLDNLPKNPLPAVIIVQAADDFSETENIEDLLERLARMQDIELAQLDMQWLQRLRSLNQTAQRAIQILAALLSISVLLVIGNTIRLSILNRQAEIRVIKLVGGTNAFVRRPFLYTGFWYGFLGGIVAWLTLLTSLAVISGPINALASQYDNVFSLQWLAGELFLALPLLGVLLGVLGAWLAVGKHLNAIEPN